MVMFTKEQSLKFEGNKILYHYTSIKTVIENIFPSNRLRLSPVIAASDPMEHNSPNPSVSAYGYMEDHDRLSQNIDGLRIAEEVNKYYKSLRQLCLCCNSEIDFEGHHTGVFEPIDHFGFAKPRMWDQYADKYKGVCIALSRDKLYEHYSPDFEILDIRYTKNHMFKTNIDTSSIDLNEVEKIGEHDYLDWKCKSELKKICEKHIDYQDENECKLITTSEDDYAYIDIRNCIKGIFITSIQNYVYEPLLKNIATNYKVPLFKISIRRTGMSVLLLC